MSFDGFFTHHISHELDETLRGGRISKIHQPYENEVVLIIRNNGVNHKLLLSAHPAYARIQLTKMSYENPSTAPNFCMMLRKYLESAILETITQIENDRVVHFSFSRRNELGDLENIVLIVELMGRHSAVILVNKETGKILDCMKHVGPSQNSYRLLLPGTEYIQPPQNDQQINPFSDNAQQLFHLLSKETTLTASYLQENFQGLGKDTATEIAYRLNTEPQEKLKLWRELFSKEFTVAPTWTVTENKEFFSPFPLDYLDASSTSYPTLSELLDAFYQGKAERERVKQQAGNLIKKVATDYKKNTKKIKKLKKELEESESAGDYQIKGELLTTYLYLVEPGQTEITLNNYYTNEPITIQLSAQLNPAQNAQKYFKRYNKLKTGALMIQEQLDKARQEELYLSSIISQIELATPADISVIREELISEGYMKERKKLKRAPKLSKPEHYISSDGDDIFVGKNNLQNDQLTLKSAKKTDIWLHAKDIPGSHVIIKNSHPSDQTLEEAANLAGYYSKYRLSSQVPIDYVQVKHIKKPNGAKPGYVIYENQQTLFITPSKEMIDKLKKG